MKSLDRSDCHYTIFTGVTIEEQEISSLQMLQYANTHQSLFGSNDEEG